MLSICCCGINNKYDIDCLVKTLAYHNQDTEFEVVYTHDDRVNDGSTSLLSTLQKQYPWFKVVEHTKQDTIQWLEWLVDLYDTSDRFSRSFLEHLKSNLLLFKADQLINPEKEFLWISSGMLYNKAAYAASGDYFLVTPSDFLYLFKLSDLEEYMKPRTYKGLYYAKPNAIWTRISNSPAEWLHKQIDIDANKSEHPPGSRLAAAQRDYLLYPSGPEDLHLVDFRHKELINLTDPNFFSKMERYTRECTEHPDDQSIGPSFHGVHVMSRDAFYHLGGFTEGFYGRAFADDQMSKRGIALASMCRSSHILPMKYSIGWIGQGEWLPSRFDYRSSEEHTRLLTEKEGEFMGKHPIPGASGWSYLHHKYPDNNYVNSLNTAMSKYLSLRPEKFTHP